MSRENTGGFDLLIQISEDELNTQIQTLAAAGELSIPSSIESNFTMGTISGTAFLNFDLPTVSLDAPSPTLIIELPFRESRLDVGLVVDNLSGLIRIEHPITVHTDGNTQQALLDFTSGVGNVVFDFDSASESILAPAILLGITIPQMEAAGADAVEDSLVNEIQELAITPPITTNDENPTIPSSFEVSTINDGSSLDEDILNFGIRMNPGTGGDLSGVTGSFIPNGEESVLMMANNYLLFDVIRPQLASSLGIPLSSISSPCTLNRSVPAPGGEGTLTALRAFVEGSRIKVEGRATASGSGWDAESTFSFFLNLSLEEGEIVVTNTEPTIDTDVDMAWWVWLLGLGLGGLFGGIVGAIVGAIVVGIVKGVIKGIANDIISTGITSGLDAIPPFPLGPIGSGLNLSTILLDDLELRGNIIRSFNIPILSRGQESSQGAFALNLDNGQRFPYNSTSPHIDVKYSPSRGLDFVNGARFSNTGETYGGLTVLHISKMNHTKNRIFDSQIPSVINMPFIHTGRELVVGIETSQGRMAKAKIYKDLIQGNQFEIGWTTYDTPTPTVTLNSNWTTVERGERLDPRLVDGECCPAYEAAQKCKITAWPKLLAFPVDIQWCIDGIILKDEEGKVFTKSGELGFKVNGRFLEITTSIGQKVNSKVCVSVIDAKGIEVFVCTKIVTDGIGTDCPSERITIIPGFELIPIESIISRPILVKDLEFKKILNENLVIK